MRRGQRRTAFTTGDISRAIADHEAGAKVPEICRRLGISEGTFYAWRARLKAEGDPATPSAPPHPDPDGSTP
jgi:transposase-like protein